MLWAVVVALSGIYAIGSYLEQLSVSRFDDLLSSRHTQAIVALVNGDGNAEIMPQQLADPAYQRPFSGIYWQAQSEDGDLLVSRSLADTLLPMPALSGADPVVRNIEGPVGQSLRAMSQLIAVSDGQEWIVTVAESTAGIAAEQDALSRRLNVSFALSGLFAMTGALLVVLFTLRPLAQLRRDVTMHRDKEGDLPIDEYPQEVQPLVLDINHLLERNREIIGRSRRQTADLAHALKTPSSIMRNELSELAQRGIDVRAAIDALDRVDSQLNRSFARMKATQESAAENATTDIDVSLGRMARAFAALCKNKDRAMEVDIAPGMHARINQSDLEEVIGNLLDNALKWSTAAIGLRAMALGKHIQIFVEDDGPGIAEGDVDRALTSGQRLDESKPGSGLGLAIVQDLAAAYKGHVAISKSERMGGTRVTVTLLRAGE